ncbi:MAG: zinc dependent phospholipase C family protein [Thermoplasmata archaeon]
MNRYCISIFLSSSIIPLVSETATAWSNGGQSSSINNPVFGTHDYIAKKAASFLPASERAWILNNENAYLFGTEVPDYTGGTYGIGDTGMHHIYFKARGMLVDDASARRAAQMYQSALEALKKNEFEKAAVYTGAMTHYISDSAVHAHTMGSNTVWGEERVHSAYESDVYWDTRFETSFYDRYISFDGQLEPTSAYWAAVLCGHDATFDNDNTGMTNVNFDINYNYSNPEYKNRIGRVLNRTVNVIADVLHTLYIEWKGNISQELNIFTPVVYLNEVEIDPPGADSGYQWFELFIPTGQEKNASGIWLSTSSGRSYFIYEKFNFSASTQSDGSGNSAYPSGYYYVAKLPAKLFDPAQENITLYSRYGVVLDTTGLFSDGKDDTRTAQRMPDSSKVYESFLKGENISSSFELHVNTMGQFNKQVETSTCITVATIIILIALPILLIAFLVIRAKIRKKQGKDGPDSGDTGVYGLDE